MLRIDEISVGRATGRMSPTSHGSPPTSKKKPSKKANFSDLRRKSKEHQNSVTPHISKMLANQLNPIAFMHRENQSKNTSSTGGATLSPGDTESPFTEIKEAFDVIDEDKDGQISVEDLGKFMRLIGMSSNNSELAELIFEFDSDGDGFLSYQDFVKVLNQDLFDGDPNGDIVREAFRQFDQEGTGYVSDADLCSIFQQLGDERLVDEELAEITREYNVTNEGAINYETMIEGIQEVYKRHRGSHDQH